MTTIAYRDGVLASDSQITLGDTKSPEHGRKIIRLPDGGLVGAAGSYVKMLRLLHAMENAERVPAMKDIDAILISASGVVYRYDKGNWVKRSVPYAAIGSGSDFALTSMWLGNSAPKAVLAGIHFDTNSGGKVQTVKLKRKT